MSAVTLGAWVAALLVAKLLRSTVIKGESTPFVMELPPYRIPTLRGLCIHTWERSWSYIRKAGTVILAISVLLWAAMTFPALPEDQAVAFDERIAAIEAQSANETDTFVEAVAGVEAERAEAELRNSYAGRAGVGLESLTSLAGFNWRVNISLLGGFAAKEVIVSTLGTAYALGEIDAEEAAPLSEKITQDKTFSKAAALALIAFVILYAPCFVTIVAMAREVGWKWAGFSMVFNTALAYGVAVVLYQAARLVA